MGVLLRDALLFKVSRWLNTRNVYVISLRSRFNLLAVPLAFYMKLNGQIVSFSQFKSLSSLHWKYFLSQTNYLFIIVCI